MWVRHDQAAAGTEHTGELRDAGTHVGGVTEGESADCVIHRPVLERHVDQIGLVEHPLRQLCARVFEHRAARVDADHVMTGLGEAHGVSAGAAGGIEHDRRAWKLVK